MTASASTLLLNRLLAAAAVAVALAALPASADDVGEDEEGEVQPAEPAAPAAPEPEPPATPELVVPEPAPEPAPPEVALPEGRRHFSKGTHRITLFGGFMTGETARDAGILAAPLTGQPGAVNYPAETPLRVELEDAATYGLRWSYHFDPERHWGIELGVQRMSSEIVDPEDFDLAAVTAQIQASSVPTTPVDLQAPLIARLERNRGPYDIDLTFVEVGAVYVVNPRSRWPAELNAGIGWVDASMDELGVFERLVISRTFPGDVAQVANEVEEAFPGRCQADNDPCIEQEAASGLTWHFGGGVSYAFTDRVHLRLNGRVRFIEQILDPGDSFVNGEGTLGLSFLLGGE